MYTKRKKFEAKGFDESEYERLFHRHQEEYIRKKLRIISDYHQKKGISEISKSMNIHIQSIHKYLNIYISGGFESLVKKTIRPQKSQLNQEQESAFKEILLNKSPFELGFEGNIWTGELMRQYLKKEYGISYKSGIYTLLKRLNLSHQKAHSDYGNASKEEQKAFINELKNTILEADESKSVIKFDEFSIKEKGSSYYGWAEKNTRPTFKTNEKKTKEKTAF